MVIVGQRKMSKKRLLAGISLTIIFLTIGIYVAIMTFSLGNGGTLKTQVDLNESENIKASQNAPALTPLETEFPRSSAPAIAHNLLPLKSEKTLSEPQKSKENIAPIANHLKVKLESAANDFVNAQTTAFSENYTRSITKKIVQDAPQLKATVETFQSFELLEKSFGERQAEFRVLAAAVLAELSNHPTQRPLLLNTVNAISHEIEVSGNQKRRTLDLEDAVMALCESFQPAELEQAFESHFSKIYFSKTTVVPIKLALRECAEKLNQPESVIAKISKQFTLKKSDNKDET